MTHSIEPLLDRALKLHQLGQLFDAQRLYLRILRKIPMHFEVLHMLGVSYLQEKAYQTGIPSIEKALIVKPDSAEAHFNLGNAYRELKQFDRAIVSYRRTIALKPDFVDAHNNLGNTLQDAKHFKEAIACFESLLAIRPDYCDAHNNLGVIYRALGQYDQAIASYRQALALNPDYAEAHYNIGVIHSDHKRYTEAIESYKQAIGLKPDHARAHHNLGEAHGQLEQYEESITCYMIALAIKPDYVDAGYHLGLIYLELKQYPKALAALTHAVNLEPEDEKALNSLGVCYSEVENHEEALACFKKAVAINPDYAKAHFNMGVALNELYRFEEAVDCYKKALTLLPDHAEAHYNMGVSHNELYHYEEAKVWYERALSLKPDLVEATFNIGLIMLQFGQLEEGWAKYQLRRQSRKAIPLPEAPYPAWSGEQDISGCNLLIQLEQGLGDSIQMLRYVHLLEQQNITCWIQAHPPLVKLIARNFPKVRIIERDVFPKDIDYHVLVMSLPFAMKTFSEAAIPRSVPYLIADPARISYWRERLVFPHPLVGLVWRGNPTHKNDRNRSMKLAELMPVITANPDIRFVTLQKDLTQPEKELLEPHPNVRILDSELTDFDESAAVISNLDLLLTVDSAPAHLAGALAVPTWILLCFCGEWRWLTERSDSPWYPTVELIRQKTVAVWSDVIAETNRKLSNLKKAN